MMCFAFAFAWTCFAWPCRRRALIGHALADLHPSESAFSGITPATHSPERPVIEPFFDDRFELWVKKFDLALEPCADWNCFGVGECDAFALGGLRSERSLAFAYLRAVGQVENDLARAREDESVDDFAEGFEFVAEGVRHARE